jgi:Leucine-rich repeat (LRR) protein
LDQYNEGWAENIKFSSDHEKPANLTKVRILFKRFDLIVDGIGEHFPNLQELYLGNNIKYTRRKDFVKMVKLKRLNLIANSLRLMDEDSFEDLKNLEILELDGCRLTNLPLKIFYNLRKLRKIHLSENQLMHLDKTLFVNNQEIEEIDLNFNQLAHLDKAIFYNQRKLKKIHLSSSLLTHLDKDLFINNQLLEVISLDQNKLKHIDIDFLTFSKIKKILLALNLCISLNFYERSSNKLYLTSVRELQEEISQNCYEIESTNAIKIKFHCAL